VLSLRQCAPLWPIAELEIVLCLTNSLLPLSPRNFRGYPLRYKNLKKNPGSSHGLWLLKKKFQNPPSKTRFLETRRKSAFYISFSRAFPIFWYVADGPVCLLTPLMSPFLYCLGALRALVIVIVTASARLSCDGRRTRE
jgi:hypothetical protein